MQASSCVTWWAISTAHSIAALMRSESLGRAHFCMDGGRTPSVTKKSCLFISTLIFSFMLLFPKIIIRLIKVKLLL